MKVRADEGATLWAVSGKARGVLVPQGRLTQRRTQKTNNGTATGQQEVAGGDNVIPLQSRLRI